MPATVHAFMPPVPSSSETDMRSLVGHNIWVDAETRLEEAHQLFCKHENLQCVPVLEAGRVIGLCARRQVGVVLGARYGFALFARKPIRDHMLSEVLTIGLNEPLPEILQRVFSRSDESFDDDVVLIADDGSLVGTIFVPTLVRLQHRLLLSNINQLEEQKLEIERRHEEMEADLKMAAGVQQAMLPQQYPTFPTQDLPELSALLFAHRYVPSGLVSGDFFQVLRLGDDTAGVFICDVMGHGVRSALVVAMLRAIVEELSAHALDPGVLLARMNQDMRMILRQHDDPMFASAVYMVVDAAAGTIRCAIAGHPRPLHVRREAGTVEPLQVPRSDYGPALGLFDHMVFPVCELAFAPGDMVLLFTDGLFEASSDSEESGREEFGMERLLETVRENMALPTDRILDCTLDVVRTFSGSQTFVDDVCILAVEAAPATLAAARQAEAPAVSEEAPKVAGALAM